MTTGKKEENETLLGISTPTALVALKWTDRGATQLSAIKGFKNLKVLDLAGNRLTAGVPELKSLRFLNKLSLARNEITQIWELPGLLEHLNLAYNQIEEFTLRLASLKTLDISHNKLKSLSGIRYLPSLTSLYASNNLLQDVLDLDRLPHLIEVDFSSNLLSSDSASALFLISSLSAINLRDNPAIHSLTPADEWLQDKDSLFYRNPNRLKDLKTSRFRREIKRKQESFEIAQESASSSPSKRNCSFDEANSSTRKFRREAFVLRKAAELGFESRPDEADEQALEASLRRKSIEALFDEVIAHCKLPVVGSKGTWGKYERAAQLLKDRESERLDLLARISSLEDRLLTQTEQRELLKADFEAAMIRTEESYEEQIREMNKCLGEYQLKQVQEGRYGEVSFLLDLQSGIDVLFTQEAPNSAPQPYPRFQGESMSDSKRYLDETSCEKAFSRRLANGKVLVSKSLGQFIERLKSANSKLKEKLGKVKSQRDRYADAIKKYEETFRRMATAN